MKHYWYMTLALFFASCLQAMNIQEEKKKLVIMPYQNSKEKSEHVIDIKPIDYAEYIQIERRLSDESERKRLLQEQEVHNQSHAQEELSECAFESLKLCLGVTGLGVIIVLLVISKVYS